MPNWYNKWLKDNPTDIYGPAILIGALGGAVFLAILIVTWGQPYATASMQTGPRGAGMSVTKFVDDPANIDPSIEGYYTEERIEPEADAGTDPDGDTGADGGEDTTDGS